MVIFNSYVSLPEGMAVFIFMVPENRWFHWFQISKKNIDDFGGSLRFW